MRVRKIFELIVPFALLLLLSGCASTTAPSGWLPSADESQKEAYGAWISVEYSSGSKSLNKAEGEFIAVSQDTVFILSQDELFAIPLDKIKHGTLTTYDSQHGILALWTLGGSLSTASHGVGAIISLPVWILSGTIATTGQSFAPVKTFPARSWDELKKYARFPQGLPKGIEVKKLRSKVK